MSLCCCLHTHSGQPDNQLYSHSNPISIQLLFSTLPPSHLIVRCLIWVFHMPAKNHSFILWSTLTMTLTIASVLPDLQQTKARLTHIAFKKQHEHTKHTSPVRHPVPKNDQLSEWESYLKIDQSFCNQTLNWQPNAILTILSVFIIQLCWIYSWLITTFYSLLWMQFSS